MKKDVNNKRNRERIYSCFLGICFLFFPCLCGAQLLYNRGAVIYSQTGSLIKVNGTVLNDKAGEWTHYGTVYIDSSFQNKSVARGNGSYYVKVDWINDSAFFGDSSHVFLNGANQLITGDSVTSFFDLTLQGSGIKTLKLNALVNNRINLNDFELSIGTDTLFVLNPDTGAVLYKKTFGGEGFASTDTSGAFVRKTNSVEGYVFPLGSSSGTKRFRSVTVKPDSISENLYSAAFMNYDANNEGFSRSSTDSSFCLTNGLYFHKIGRIFGDDPGDVTVSYSASPDGYWNGLGNWQSSWKNIGSDAPVDTSGYMLLTRKSWSKFDKKEYLFFRKIPRSPVIIGDSIACGNGAIVIYNVDSAEGSYNWSSSSGVITTGQGTGQVGINWDTATFGIVSVVVTDTAGCKSIASTKNSFVTQILNALFSVSDTMLFPYETVKTTDKSENSVSRNWDFGNGKNSDATENIQQYIDTGFYIIMLVAKDQYGCRDTAYARVFVSDELVIPNVFTPNNDGVNDVFQVAAGSMKDYHIEIFNRWGQLMYVMKKGQPFWDGYNTLGNECTEGTYFFIFKGEKSDGKEIVKNGALTLLR